ncbi:PAS domain-containing protein, partial [Acinetobacter baumannii]
NAFVRQLLDSTDQGFFSIDREGIVTLCNAAFLKLLGYAGEKDVLGRSIHEVILTSADDGSGARGECAVLKAARDGVTTHVESEDFLRVDGSSFPVQ